MSKLLHAGIRRYCRSIIFWLCIFLTVVIGAWSGYQSRQRHGFEMMYVCAELAIMAILMIWMVGREYEEGIFRNRFVAGFRKGTVYLSELLLGLGACLLLFLIFALLYGAFNSYLLYVLPGSVSVRIVLCFLFINLGVAALFVTISSLIRHRAVTLIVSVLLVTVMAIAGDYVHNALGQPEYYYIVPDRVETSDTVQELTPLLEEYRVKNEYYLDGWLRPVAQVLDDLNFLQSIEEELAALARYTGFASYDNGRGFTYWDSPDSQFSYEEGQDEMYTENLYYAPVILVVTSVLGYCLFRKKEFK